jgi:tetratricopeptide (TPR) repeat protein
MKAAASNYFCAMKNWLPLLIVVSFLFSCKQKENKTTEVTSAQKQLISQLQQQVKQNPDSASLRMRLVNTLDSLKLYNEALQQTDSLIKRDSLNNGLWYTKAQLLESNKDTAGAIKSYERALKIYPSVDAQLSLANLFAESKNRSALLICENVRRMGLGRETDASCDFIAGVYNARTKNNALALSLFDKAISNNYTLMEAYMEKGFIYYESKKYNDALKVFSTAITVNQMYPDAYYWKAKCEEALGNKDEAITDYKRSLGLDKGLKEASEALERLNG